MMNDVGTKGAKMSESTMGQIKMESESTMGQGKGSDLISKRTVFNIIDWAHYNFCIAPSGEWVFEYIKGLIDCCEDESPSANQWIPCSERVPEEVGSYPVWTARGFGNHLSTSYWDGKGWSLRVVAWMPPPKPYAERSEDGRPN